MSNDEKPPNSGVRQRDESPPPQQPPPYHDSVAELAADAPASSVQQGDATRSEQLPERPRTKPEGSAYPSAYRPGEAPNTPHTAYVHVSAESNFLSSHQS